jgi:hypothetical protein
MSIITRLQSNPCVRELSVADPNFNEQLRQIQEENWGALSPAGKFEAIAYEFYMNNMLMRPGLHITNMTSNAMMAFQRPLNTIVEAMLSKTGLWGDASPVHFGEAVAEMHGFASGSIVAIRLLADRLTKWSPTNLDLVVKHNLPSELAFSAKTEQARKALSAEHLGLDPESILGQAVEVWGSLTRISGSSLGFEDALAKTVNYHMQMARDGYNQGVWETGEFFGPNFTDSYRNYVGGVNDGSNPLGAKRAADSAEKYTLTDSPKSALTIGLIKASKAVALLRWHVPFIRTLDRAVRNTYENSPLIAPELATAFAKGDRSAEHMAAVARMMAGTALISGAYAIFGEYLTGRAPKNPEERALWKKQGFEENTLRTPMGNVPFRSMSPVIGSWMQSLAIYRQSISNIDARLLGDPASETFMDNHFLALSTSVAAGLSDTAWLGNIVPFMAAYHDLQTNTVPEKAAMFYTKMLASATVPYAATAYARKDDPGIKEFRNPLQFYMSKVPELNKGLTTLVDLFGEDITYDNFNVPDVASPVTGKDPIVAELQKVKVKYPERSRIMENVQLTQEECRAAYQLAGKGDILQQIPSMRESLTDKINDPTYQAMEHDEAKAGMLHEVILSQYQMGRAALWEDPRFAESLQTRLEAYNARKEELSQ